MIQSIIIYGLLGLILYFLGSKNFKNKSQFNSFINCEIIISILVFSVISGIRWKVGTDHLNYLETYENFSINNINQNKTGLEYGFYLLTYLLSYLNLHFSLYFGIISAIQIGILFFTFKDEKYIIKYIGLIIVFGGQYHLWMNGMRQIIAALIFVYSIKYIINRSFIKYILLIILASTFHKSAIILLIVYIVPIINIFRNRIIAITLLILSIIIGSNKIFISETNQITNILMLIGYDDYANRIDYFINEMNVEMGFGPRRIITNLICISHILLFNRMSEYFSDKKIILYYNFSVFGIIYFNLFSNSGPVLLRPTYYFMIFSSILSSYQLFFLKQNINSLGKISYISFFIISISYLIIAIIADFDPIHLDFTNYRFYWDFK